LFAFSLYSCSTPCPNAVELKAIAWRACGDALLDSPEERLAWNGIKMDRWAYCHV